MDKEEKKAIENLKEINQAIKYRPMFSIPSDTKLFDTILNLIEKQSKEIEEYKKQLDLDNECEIALNNRIMDLENADKKWEDKIKAKTIEIKNRPVKDEFITVSQGKLNTIIDMESLLEKE